MVVRAKRRGAPSYRTLRRYGLTVEQARAAVGADEVWEPAEPRAAEPVPEAVVVRQVGEPKVVRLRVVDEVATISPRAWTSICERVPDPMAPLRRGAGVPVR